MRPRKLFCPALSLISVLAVGQIRNQPPKIEPPVRMLHLASEKQLSAPTFGWTGLVQSDADSNLYFHVNRGSQNDGTIQKVDARNGSSTTYEMPHEFQGNAYFIEFQVTPSGVVSVLYRDRKQRYLVVRYDSDGKANPLTTDVPAHVHVSDFASFESGEILVGGFFEAEAEETVRGHQYVALLNANGQLLKTIYRLAGSVDLAKVFSGIHQGMAVAGDDGNLYLLQASEIVCVSTAGEIVRRLKFEKAGKDYMPLQLFVSGGKLSVVQHRLRKSEVNEIRIQVLDAYTGELLATYQSEEKLSNMVVSFSSAEGFAFLNGEGATFKILNARLD